MDINQVISSHANQPITHQLLKSWLKDYKRPNDKIHALKSEGILEAVKKGFYIAGPQTLSGRPENTLLANHLLGPSYVSMETALSYYGIIPERVYEITSMTTKASRSVDTPIGLFSYAHLPLPYYSFGLNRVELAGDQFAIMASPEKALCDKIVNTSGLTLRSRSYAWEYLTDNLRIDEENLIALNSKMIRTWLQDAPKRDSLEMIIKVIDSL